MSKCFWSQRSSEPGPRVGGARQTLVKKVIWVGDSNLGKLEKELVIMMFCAGTLNTPAPIPDSYSAFSLLSNILSILKCLVIALSSRPGQPWHYSLIVSVCSLRKIFLLVLSSGEFMENICVEIIPPGIIHLMIAGFWPSCSWEPRPTASKHINELQHTTFTHIK